MSKPPTRVVAAASLAVFSFFFLLFHNSSQPEVDVIRDATMFGTVADSSRVVVIRTDFASFYYACKAVAVAGNMYDARFLDSLASKDRVANHVLPYLYPPFFAIAAMQLSELQPGVAQRVWDLLQVAVLSVVAVLAFLILAVSSSSKRLDWIVTTIIAAVIIVLPFRMNIDFGQMNFLVLLFIMLSLFLMNRDSDFLAGISLAVATLLKVTPVILLVAFFVSKRWKAVSGFCVGMMILILITFDIAGTVHWRQFLDFLPNMGYARNVEGSFHPSIVANFSLAGFYMRVFVGEGTVVRLMTMITGVFLFAMLLYVHLKYGSRETELFILLPYLLLMVVLSPVTWLHHVVYIFPGVVFSLFSCSLFFEGGRKYFRLLILVVLTFLSALDFQAVYAMISIPEGLRPFVTSMNLVFLISLFFFSLKMISEMAGKKVALLVTG